MKTASQFLSDAFSRQLGRALILAVTTEPIQPELLEEKGRQILQGFRYEKRKQEWLCGRHALFQVMRAVGDKATPDAPDFPNHRYSLTHSKGKAIAVADVDGQLDGIGIDYESMRPMKPGIEHFFLAADEQLGLQKTNDVSTDLLRLWTIKESLFKSDPENRRRLLKDYRLPQPANMHGEMSLHDMAFHYSCMMFDDGFISVAISNSSKNV